MHRHLDSLALILEYPAPGYRENVTNACRILSEELKGGKREKLLDAMIEFEDIVTKNEDAMLEEYYTRTFDLNPVCSLDLGWHLYAENYERGTFLVELRDALRKHGIAESEELPDHLPSVLRLLARMPDDEAVALAQKSVLPALRKMREGFQDENFYGNLVKLVEGVLNDMYVLETRSE